MNSDNKKYCGNLRNYILVTVCKNEGDNLEKLIDSIIMQTLRPLIWVIVDDGSTDDTPGILKTVIDRISWIQVIRLNKSKRDLGLHYANILKIGFDNAILNCENQGLVYNYLGNLDGDLILPPTFFENLIKEFEADSKLGIASGGTNHIIGDRIVHAKLSVDEPSGGHMLIRRRCFEECGGIPASYSIDAVLKAKARIREWRTRRFESNRAIEKRDVGQAEGYWKGKIQSGKGAYYLNFNPIHIMVKSVNYSIKSPYYTGVAYLVGYFGDLIRKQRQTDDPEIKRYFWNKWKGKKLL